MSIQYPSISVCKKYSLEYDLGFQKLQNDTKIAVESLINMTWNLEQQFYFFTHPGILNMTFPCTTLLGGSTPG